MLVGRHHYCNGTQWPLKNTDYFQTRELVKTTILKQDPPLGKGDFKDTTYLRTHHMNITDNILLAFKFELTQEYSAGKIGHY